MKPPTEEILNFESKTQTDILDSIFRTTVKDISNKFKTTKAKQLFGFYSKKINELSSSYIVNGFLDGEAMTGRYFAELGVLHITVEAINYWHLKGKATHPKRFFDLNKDVNFYSWYQLPVSLRDKVREWVDKNAEIMSGGEWIETFSNNYLSSYRRRDLGEFYTPNWVASHMIDISGLNDKLPDAICDPACGNGNLLGTLLLRLIERFKIDKTPEKLIEYINNNIYGYDIQPIAVLLTRLRLISIALSTKTIKQTDNQINPFQAFILSNIKLADPLTESSKVWNDPKFDYIISNPPFLKIKKNQVPHYSAYSDIIGGQPNLYQFFVWWAIKAAKYETPLTFIIPLSVKSGQYLSELRKNITKYCDIKAFTLLQNRKGTFVDVDQQVLIISLKKTKKPDLSKKVSIRVKTSLNKIDDLIKLALSQESVILDPKNSSSWFLSDNILDYSIFSKVLNKTTTIKELDLLKTENGGFVWNQNIDTLSSFFTKESFPLISSPSISTHKFSFPSSDTRVKERSFAKEVLGKKIKTHKTIAVFIKRTTPEKKIGRRIVGTLLPKDFLVKYPNYYAENHVNLIKLSNPSEDLHLLYGISIWLNSKLANFIFSMINGSAHLSKFELDNMPVSLNLLTNLAIYGPEIYSNNKIRTDVYKEIDEKIFMYFKMNKKQIERINSLIPSIQTGNKTN